MVERTNELKGNIKQGVGKLTGNRGTEAEGRSQAQGAKARRETEGTLQEAAGSVKEAAGDLLDSARLQTEGKADRLKGKVQRAG